MAGLALLVCAQLTSRLAVWEADPDWSRSVDMCVEVDGGFYAADAINAVQGHERPAGSSAHYDVPLHTWLVDAALSLRLDLAGARLPGVALGVLLVLVTAGAAWVQGGPRAALLTGLLLLSLPGQFDQDLAMSPYSFVSLGVASSLLLLALASRRERLWEVALLGVGALLVLAGTAAIRKLGLLATPAVALGVAAAIARRTSRRGRSVLGAVALGLVALGVLAAVAHPGLRAEATKHIGTLTIDFAFRRWLQFGQESGAVTFALGGFVVWTLALVRELRALVVRAEGWSSSRLPLTVALHTLILSTLGYMSLLVYRPPRYWTFLLPALALVSGGFLIDLLEGRVVIRPWPLWEGARWQRLAAFGLHTLVLFWIIHQLLFSLLWGLRFLGAPQDVFELKNGLAHVLAGLLLLVVTLAVGHRRPAPGKTGGRAAAGLLIFTLGLNAAFLAHSIGYQTHALAREGEVLDWLLPAEARLAGPLGPTLALLSRRTAVAQYFESELTSLTELRESGATHVLVDDSHIALLEPLRDQFIELRVAPYREFSYTLLRIRETLERVPPTPCEQAAIDFQEGRTADATRRLEAFLKSEPEAAQIPELRALLRRTGDGERE